MTEAGFEVKYGVHQHTRRINAICIYIRLQAELKYRQRLVGQNVKETLSRCSKTKYHVHVM